MLLSGGYMAQTLYPSQRTCRIPAKCYNLAHLARKRAKGYLRVFLPGMTDYMVVLTGTGWQCWNRKLNQQLISWSGFKNGERSSLDEPVACTQILHHAYCRTIVFQVYDYILQAAERELEQQEFANQGRVIHFNPENTHKIN